MKELTVVSVLTKVLALYTHFLVSADKTALRRLLCCACSADAPTGVKIDPNGKVLQRLRSTAASTVLPQTSLVRSLSTLSAPFPLSGSYAGPPSIASPGTLADAPLQLNRWVSLHHVLSQCYLFMAVLLQGSQCTTLGAVSQHTSRAVTSALMESSSFCHLPTHAQVP